MRQLLFSDSALFGIFCSSFLEGVLQRGFVSGNLEKKLIRIILDRMIRVVPWNLIVMVIKKLPWSVFFTLVSDYCQWVLHWNYYVLRLPWIFRSSKVCWQTTLLMHSCGPLHFQSTLGMSPITHMYNLLFQLETLYALNFVANNFYHVVMSQLSKIYHSNCKN